jgi:hypothetical protein
MWTGSILTVQIIQPGVKNDDISGFIKSAEDPLDFNPYIGELMLINDEPLVSFICLFNNDNNLK